MDFPFTRSFWPRLMMRAFAIECLIKAHFLLAGKKLCEGGKYIGIRQDKSHDLAKLARKADIAISDAEANLLDRLTDVSTGRGRYPIFKSFDVHGKKHTVWASRDEKCFRPLISRLVEPLDKQSVYAELLKEA